MTPSYNQAEFLEETIRSVLLQGYPELEYIIIDGGSRDGSVEIIERYSPWLAFWRSERDRGQSDAINTGFRKATGDVLAWLNSDDIYYANALGTAAALMQPTRADLLLCAMDTVVLENGDVRVVKRSSPNRGQPIHFFPILRNGRQYAFHYFQPASFWSRDLWLRTGGLDERYEYVMDLEWCCRALTFSPEVKTAEDLLARFTLHTGSKTQDFLPEHMIERALMFLRLARRPEFRTLPCVWSALHPVQRSLALLSARAKRRRQRFRRLVFAAGARAVKVARHGVPGLRGTEMLPEEAATG